MTTFIYVSVVLMVIGILSKVWLIFLGVEPTRTKGAMSLELIGEIAFLGWAIFLLTRGVA